MIILIAVHFDQQGKEFETRLKEKKPGDLSDDLRTALGMPIGPNNHLVPPPWLIAMQRYGPPPSYPNLKIPGLNAPIPEVRSFNLKPRPNDRNMATATCRVHYWAQHVVCVWLPCCDVLRHVGCCWLKFECNTSQHGGKTHTTCCAQQCCDMLPRHVAIVWPVL